MKIKRLLSVVLTVLMIATVCTVAVSAECNYSHGSSFLVYSCSGEEYDTYPVDCYWQGGYGGGYFHGTNCKIRQVYNYTTEKCDFPGGCKHETSSGNHFCYAYHSQCSDLGNIPRCPY